MDEGNDSTKQSSKHRLKIVRLIDKYNLEDVGEEMEKRWVSDSDNRSSLRELADYFNKKLLTKVLTNTDEQPLNGEIDNIYRLLTSDKISDAEQIRVNRKLERKGIDVSDLQADFVTYQAIRTYLQDHRGAEYTVESGDKLEREKENIDRLKGRTSSVIESKLEDLNNTDKINIGEFRTIVSTNIVCEDCGAQIEVGDLIERGSCDCST